MQMPENEPDLLPELGDDDEYVQITDLDPPDAPTHVVTRFWRFLTPPTPRMRRCMTIATGVCTLVLLIVFLSMSVLPVINALHTAQQPIRNPVSFAFYPLEMTVVDNVAYVTTSSGLIEALRVSNGSLLWQYQPDVQPLEGPIVVNGMAYFMVINEELNAPQGSVYALRTRDGKLMWHRDFQGLTPEPLDVQQGMILLAADNTLIAIHASDGSTAWQYNTGYLPPEYLLLDSKDGRAYLNSQFGDIYALDIKNGDVLWLFAVHNQHFSLTQVVDGIVYASAQDGTLYAIQAPTGRLFWHFSGSSGKNLAGALLTVQERVVYVSTSDGTMNALRLSDGRLLWQYKQEGTIWEAPIAEGNIVYLNSQLGIIDALRVDTGAFLWHYKSSDTESALVSVANERLYIVSRDGALNALNATTGAFLWGYRRSATAQGSPIVANDTVLMTFSDGMMYALRASDGTKLWNVPVSIFGDGFTFVLLNTIFVGAPQGGLSALRLNDGLQLWHYTTTGV